MTLTQAKKIFWLNIALFLTAVEIALFGWYVTWPGTDLIITFLLPFFGGCLLILVFYSWGKVIKND